MAVGGMLLCRGSVADGARDAVILRRALEARVETISGIDISQADGVLRLGFAGTPTVSGATVSESTVDGIPAAYTCIRILADGISQSLPLLYRRLDGGGREEARDHPLYATLKHLINPELTAADWRDVMARSLLGWGNAYAEIVRDSQGRVAALWPLHPGSMTVDRVPGSGRKRWTYTRSDGTMQTWLFDAERPPVHHWMINSLDGLVGRSPVRVLRESLGLTKAAEEFGARFFGKGAHPSGILTTDQRLTPDAAKTMRDQWERLHSGLERTHRTAVMSNGLKFQPLSIPNDDAQFLETRQFQDLQIAGVFGVPAFMINATSASNWGTGIESQKNALVSLTLQPYFVKIQDAMARDFFGRRDFTRYEVEFDTTPLLRGDYATRMTGHASALNWGIKVLNEVRDEEGYNPVAWGDKPLPPLTTSSTGNPRGSVMESDDGRS